MDRMREYAKMKASDVVEVEYERTMKWLRDYDRFDDENDDVPAVAVRVDTIRTITIETSAGGPGDGFELRFTGAGRCIEGRYYWAWAFDRATTLLTPEDLETVLDLYDREIEILLSEDEDWIIN